MTCLIRSIHIEVYVNASCIYELSVMLLVIGLLCIFNTVCIEKDVQIYTLELIVLAVSSIYIRLVKT